LTHSQRLTKQPTQEAKASTLVFTLRLKHGGSHLRLGRACHKTLIFDLTLTDCLMSWMTLLGYIYKGRNRDLTINFYILCLILTQIILGLKIQVSSSSNAAMT